MLAAASWAMIMAENAVPATAPATFTAGVVNGFNPSLDVRTEMEECFAPDQVMADDTDAFIKAIEAKDLTTIKAMVMKDEPLAIKDTEKCMSDPKYADIQKAYNYQYSIVKKAMADPDWQLHALKGIKGQLATVKQAAKDAVAAWNAGDYYTAGQKVGSVDKLVFTYWEQNGAFLQ